MGILNVKDVFYLIGLIVVVFFIVKLAISFGNDDFKKGIMYTFILLILLSVVLPALK